MMVVTAIFVVLTSVVLANNSRFGNVIILQNLTHDIALSVRESQVYGIAVRRYDPSSGPGIFSYGYGVHFAPGTTFELFADVNANGKWDAGETVKQTTMSGGFTISDVCAPAGDCGKSRVDVLFKRPEPDACISVSGTVSLAGDGHCISTVQRTSVEISSARGDTAQVTIEASGQISVQ